MAIDIGTRLMVPVKGIVVERRANAEMEKDNKKRFLVDIELDEGEMIQREYDYKEVECYDAVIDPDLAALADKILDARIELQHIDEFIGRERIVYIRSYEPKTKKGKMILGECKALRGSIRAITDYRFSITIYDHHTSYLDENQMKVLLLHELKHIKEDGGIFDHTIEDFGSILVEYGINWADPGAEVPDVLGGDTDGGEEVNARAKGKG